MGTDALEQNLPPSVPPVQPKPQTVSPFSGTRSGSIGKEDGEVDVQAGGL